MEYFFRTLLLFLAEDALQLAGQSTVTNLSLIPLFLPEGRGRESVQPDAADDDCSSTFHFHFKPASLMGITQDVSLICMFSV